jgi:hypothetical protein
MFKKYKNVSKNNIHIISAGKKQIIKPNQVISGHEELSHYNGLEELYKPVLKGDSYRDTSMEIITSNNQEVQATLDFINSFDTSKPFMDYKKKTEHKTFSIITLMHKKDVYNNFINTLKDQKTNCTFELIPICNFNNEFESCSKAFNYGMSLANSDYYIFTHQDLLCPNDWIQKFKDHFDNFDRQNIKVGFIGVAGTTKINADGRQDFGALYIMDKVPGSNPPMTFAEYTKKYKGPYKEVQCLDECVMACKASLGIKYDDVNLNHYHFYGADVCLYAISKGYKNFAVDVACDHLSNGQGNFVHESHQKAFIEHGSRLFIKWRDKIPYFRTTCAGFLGPHKIWHAAIFADVNRNFNLNLPIEIRVP